MFCVACPLSLSLSLSLSLALALSVSLSLSLSLSYNEYIPTHVYAARASACMEGILPILSGGLNERFSGGLFGSGTYLAEEGMQSVSHSKPFRRTLSLLVLTSQGQDGRCILPHTCSISILRASQQESQDAGNWSSLLQHDIVTEP